jgi:hypothetical protein
MLWVTVSQELTEGKREMFQEWDPTTSRLGVGGLGHDLLDGSRLTEEVQTGGRGERSASHSPHRKETGQSI